MTFALANELDLANAFRHVERAVRLGDAPTVNSVKRGGRPRGRSEVRFLTFPPNSEAVRILQLRSKPTCPNIMGQQYL